MGRVDARTQSPNRVSSEAQVLAVGEYNDASRYPFGHDAPGIEFAGHGSYCNEVAGKFVVWQLEVRGDERSPLVPAGTTHPRADPATRSSRRCGETVPRGPKEIAAGGGRHDNGAGQRPSTRLKRRGSPCRPKAR
jgi:hypothetical protein